MFKYICGSEVQFYGKQGAEKQIGKALECAIDGTGERKKYRSKVDTNSLYTKVSEMSVFFSNWFLLQLRRTKVELTLELANVSLNL